MATVPPVQNRKVLVTGAAGFIGMHAARALHDRGHSIVGIDNFNDYYDPALKRARQDLLSPDVQVHELDITNADALARFFRKEAPDVVLHLAAQAGVRYSIENPLEYIRANVFGHTAVLEACRGLGPAFQHLVYASSSSVYSGQKHVPFVEDLPLETPYSVYAATKRSDELLSATYAHLYGLKQIGLRFFTVYGPWGRPDMAYWSFTKNILSGEPIAVFNHGDMRRDLTYIGDVVSGIVSIVEIGPVPAPQAGPGLEGDALPHRVYNIGNNRPERLMDVISVLEQATGKVAEKVFKPMQPGDVQETAADITAIARDFGFQPTTTIAEGLPAFVAWYRNWRDAAP